MSEIDRTNFKYRCKICGFECTKKHIPSTGAPVTKLGDYGNKGTPTGVEFADELYRATSLRFVAAAGSNPAYIADSANLFGDKLFKSEMPIRVVTSNVLKVNDGDYTIAARGVSMGEIRLSDSDSLTTEDAATAGTVIISRRMYKPNITQGCPSCGSLNSR